MGEKTTAISVKKINKTYRQYKSNMQKIQFLLLKRDAGTQQRILQDVSFEIKKGEKVGIIGRSQSGKTTLMRILAGVIKPDSGKVSVTGGLTSILDIRMGFDAVMTGKDNYDVMSIAMGRTADEIAQHEDAVFRFAGLSDLKNDPLKTYPKGAPSRLGFATATEIKDDIILFDAGLSFGSKAWNRACMNRLEELISGETTFVMIVNKVADAAKLCDRGIVIHEGSKVYDGPFDSAIEYFKKNCRSKTHNTDDLLTDEQKADAASAGGQDAEDSEENW